MLKLSTDDLRFLADVILNKIEFKPSDFELDDQYVPDLRDALRNMADQLDKSGEFEILIIGDMPTDQINSTPTNQSCPTKETNKP
jgi:hypothetical protein